MAGRARAVDAVGELAQLSLVSKVCTELENNCGINDPTLGTSLPTAVKELTVTQRAHLQAYTELALSTCSLTHPGVWSPLYIAHSYSPPGERVGVEERDVVTWWCHVPRVDVTTCFSVATTMRALSPKNCPLHTNCVSSGLRVAMWVALWDARGAMVLFANLDV